jgi:hypothetical protein
VDEGQLSHVSRRLAALVSWIVRQSRFAPLSVLAFCCLEAIPSAVACRRVLGLGRSGQQEQTQAVATPGVADKAVAASTADSRQQIPGRFVRQVAWLSDLCWLIACPPGVLSPGATPQE